MCKYSFSAVMVNLFFQRYYEIILLVVIRYSQL